MKVYAREYSVSYSHIDNRGIARPSAIVDFMQDVATLHSMERSISREDISGFWALTRLKYILKKPLKPYENIKITTWCSDIKGPSWYRSFSFFEDDRIIGEGITAWVILDSKTHKILRPSSIPDYQGYLPENPVPIERLDKLPRFEADFYDNRQIKYSDIDINNHLNNVKAIDIISDAIKLNSYKNKFVSEMQVNYLSESYEGDRLSIDISENESVYVYAKCEEKPRFEAEIKFSDF